MLKTGFERGRFFYARKERETMSAILFCCEPFAPNRPDPDFEDEYKAAKACGLETRLFSWEDAQSGNWAEALQKIPRAESEQELIYRGWMLPVKVYAELYSSLESRGWKLINSPEQYRSCHHFPPCYPLLEGHTPKSAWVSADAPWPEIQAALSSLGCDRAMVKDYVKSRKHEWLEACFLPDLTDETTCRRVVDTFRERQGDSLQGGLVFREFLDFESAGTHPQSGMPLSREYRRFVVRGRSFPDEPYWQGVPVNPPAWPWLDELVPRIPSNFFTVDWALTADGRPVVVELGDGQVAGRPPSLAPASFFEALKRDGHSAR